MIENRKSWIARACRCRLVVVAVLLVLSFPAPAQTVDEIEAGPKVGTNIAGLIVAKDQNGVSQEFRTLAKKRGLVLLFSRSLNW